MFRKQDSDQLIEGDSTQSMAGGRRLERRRAGQLTKQNGGKCLAKTSMVAHATKRKIWTNFGKLLCPIMSSERYMY